jgi:phosphoserine phosphatase
MRLTSGRSFGNNVAYGTIDHIIGDTVKKKKCQAFQEERGVNPQGCIYFGDSADSPQCTFCDGKPKKYINT